MFIKTDVSFDIQICLVGSVKKISEDQYRLIWPYTVILTRQGVDYVDTILWLNDEQLLKERHFLNHCENELKSH